VDLFNTAVSGCPIENYRINDFDPDSFESTVSLVNPDNIATAYLEIARTAGIKGAIDLRGTSNSRTGDIRLTIVVCGSETLALAAGATTAVIVNEIVTSTGTGPPTPITLDFSTISAYFNLNIDQSSTFCGELTLALYQDDQGATAWPPAATDVTLHGAVGTWAIEIDAA
jgi:hypothetical protein